MTNRLLIGDDVIVAANAGPGTKKSNTLTAGGGIDNVLLMIHVTTFGGTTPTLAVGLEESDDGVTWTPIVGGDAPVISAIGNAITCAHVVKNLARVTSTITGTGAAITYRVSAVVFAA